VGADGSRRDGTAQALRDAGWRGVVAVESAVEAVHALRDGRVGCAVVWDTVADAQGVLVVRLLLAADPRLKVIFAASTPDSELEAHARELPILYYHVADAGEADLIEAVAAAIGRPKHPTPETRRRLLLVDDDATFTMALTALLEASGYEVLTARSASEGLDTARRERPDAILVDIVMSSATDGPHFCREARRDPLLMHTPIAAVSALSRDVATLIPASATTECDNFLPVDAYFEKPLDLDRFLVELKHLLEEGG
jgi:CheY-like chemotaxis protein